MIQILLKASYKFSQDWVEVGKSSINIKFDATLDGTETVNAVTDKGRTAKMTVKVKKCTKDGVSLIPSGAIISAECLENDTIFKVNGVIPSDKVKRVLGELIVLAKSDEPSPDEEIGTSNLQKVGDRWPINKDLLAGAMHLPYPIAAADIGGDGTLLSISRSKEMPVETIYVIETIQFDNRQGVNGKTYKDLKMKFELTKTVPISSASGEYVSKDSRVVTFSVLSSKGTATVREERTHHSTSVFVAE